MNGDCPKGAAHAIAIDHLEARMAAIEHKVEAACEAMQDMATEARIQTARLDASSKVLIAALGILGPLLAIVVGHYLQ